MRNGNAKTPLEIQNWAEVENVTNIQRKGISQPARKSNSLFRMPFKEPQLSDPTCHTSYQKNLDRMLLQRGIPVETDRCVRQ